MVLRPVEAVALLIATQPDRSATLQQALASAGWQVAAATEPQEALGRLRSGGLAAVFCDDYLRGASPGGFLAWCRRVAPGLPFYQFATDPNASRRTFYSPDAVLPFPPEPGKLPRPPRGGGTSQASDAPAVPLEGDLRTMPLGGLLDMMAVASQSAVIRVAGDVEGVLVMDRGVLQHAEAGAGVLGVRAVAELIAAREGSFRVEDYVPPARRTLSLPTITALTEAAKLADELARDRVLVERARRDLPGALAVVAGYPLSPAAIVGDGDMRAAFDRAARLVEVNRAGIGRFTHLCLETEEDAIALVVFGEGRILAATGARGKSVRLLTALSAALRAAG